MHPVQDFDRTAFYEVMRSGGIDEINKELSTIAYASIQEKDVYSGALLMKKAGLVHKPKDKLNFFKAGRIRFETGFRADSANVEYHFLRLTIQEHAPNIVKYRGQLGDDARYIHKYFSTLTPVVRQAVIGYSKTSKWLHLEDL